MIEGGIPVLFSTFFGSSISFSTILEKTFLDSLASASLLSIFKFHDPSGQRLSGTLSTVENKLTLVVDRSLYQRLGVTGRPEIGSRRGDLRESRIGGIRRYRISLDLSNQADSKLMAKILSYPLPPLDVRLTCSLQDKFDPGNTLDSLLATAGLSKGTITSTVKGLDFISPPPLCRISQSSLEHLDDKIDERQESIQDLCFWAGAIIKRPNLLVSDQKVDPYISTLEPIGSGSIGRNLVPLEVSSICSPDAPLMPNHLLDYAEEALCWAKNEANGESPVHYLAISGRTGFVLVLSPRDSCFTLVKLLDR